MSFLGEFFGLGVFFVCWSNFILALSVPLVPCSHWLLFCSWGRVLLVLGFMLVDLINRSMFFCFTDLVGRWFLLAAFLLYIVFILVLLVFFGCGYYLVYPFLGLL